MAAPTVSGITTITPTAPTAPIAPTFQGFAVRAAAMFTINSGYSQIGDSTASLNQFIGGGTTFAPPLSHLNRGRFLIIRYASVSTTGIATFSPDRGVILLHSDLTGNNYRSIVFAESNTQLISDYLKLLNVGAGAVTKYADNGVFDPSNIVRVEFLFPKSNATNTVTQRYRFSDIGPITVIGGETGNKASFQNIYTYALADADLSSESVTQPLRNGQATRITFSMQVGDGASTLHFEDVSRESIYFRVAWNSGDTNLDTWYPPNKIGLEFRTTTGNTFLLANKKFTSRTPYYIDFNGSVSGSAYNLFFENAGDGNFDLPNGAVDAFFQDCGSIAVNRGVYNFSVFRSTSVGLIPTPNSNLHAWVENCPTGVSITSQGNYNNSSIKLKDSTNYDVSISASVLDGETINLDSFKFSTGSTTPINFVYWGTGTIYVTVSQGGLTKSTPNGGTINLIEPESQIIVNGIPQVDNAVIAVENLSTSDITFPGIASGQAIIPSVPGVDYKIMVDAPGYIRGAVVLDGATPDYTFSLISHRDIYDAGVSQSANILFNYSTFAVTISDGEASYSFADVFRTIEDYLSTPQGVLFDFPPYPQIVELNSYTRQYLIFPYDTNLDQVNPVRVKPDPTNTTDPLLSGFVTVLEGSADPLFEIFNFSEAGGRIIRFHSESVLVSGGSTGGGDATLANQTTIINHLTDIKGATWDGSTDSLEAIRDRGDAAWITATSVTVSDKTGFSLSSAGVQAIWEYSTRTLSSFGTLVADTAAAVWSAVTRSLTDKAGFSLTADERTAIATATESALLDNFTAVSTVLEQIPTNPLLDDDPRLDVLESIPTFPTNFSSLLINASGHVGRVTLVDTTTTNTDMRGTDGALLAGNYTAPDNTSITAILEDTGTTIPTTLSTLLANLATVDTVVDGVKAKTDQLTFTVANQVDANALTGGGGDDAETIYNYFTASDRADAFKATGFSTLTTADIPTAASIAGAVQTQLDDDFAALANILADIPDDVAAQSAIAAMLNRIAKISKARGLEPGITATVVKPSIGVNGSLTVSDDSFSQTLVQVDSKTVRAELDY